MITLKGNIINFDESFYGEIMFDEKINKINRVETKSDDLIMPGFIDLHCHGANGFDTMDGWSSINKMTKYHLKNGKLARRKWTRILRSPAKFKNHKYFPGLN